MQVNKKKENTAERLELQHGREFVTKWTYFKKTSAWLTGIKEEKNTIKERLEPQPGEVIEYDALCKINHRFISWNMLRVNMSSKNNVSWSKIGVYRF